MATLGRWTSTTCPPILTRSSTRGSQRRWQPGFPIPSRWLWPPQRSTLCRPSGWCSSRDMTHADSCSIRTARAARVSSSWRIRERRASCTGSRSSARCAWRAPSRSFPTTRPPPTSLEAEGKSDRSLGIAAVTTDRGSRRARAQRRQDRAAVHVRGRGAAAALLGRIPHRDDNDRVLAGPARATSRPRAVRPRPARLGKATAGAVGSLSRRTSCPLARVRPSCTPRTRSRAGSPSPPGGARRRSGREPRRRRSSSPGSTGRAGPASP